MRIRVLDDLLVDQIAAGEVVERPASVVKELVENAVDAGATDIRVQLRAGGRTLVRVVDNGSGMEREDALLCIQRHATSKIRTAEDLGTILSLGFRGEALPSIAAVSRFTLTTRPADQDVGTQLQVDGGEVVRVADAGAAVGTEIDVRSLFYNLPVRRTFLRANATELGHCLEAVQRIALIHPEVAFRVRHEERELLNAPVVDTRGQRAADLLGAQGKALIPVAFGGSGIQVEGHISPLGVHRSTRTGSSYLFVNGRFVRDPLVHRALAEAYRGLIPKGRFPVVVLELRLDPSRVDVNVHPNKIEVRFANPRDVVRVVSEGLRTAMEQAGLRQAPSAPSEAPRTEWRPVSSAMPDAVGGRSATSSTSKPPAISPHPSDDARFSPRMTLAPRAPAPAPAESPLLAFDAPKASASTHTPPAAVRFRELRWLGLIASRWMLCESGKGLVVVDARQARRCLHLAALLDDSPGAGVESQTLLMPVTVSVPGPHASALAVGKAVLKAVGFALEKVANGRFSVSAVPVLAVDADLEVLIRDIASDLADDARTLSAREAVARRVVDAASQTQEPLTAYQQQTLLASLDEVDPVAVLGHPIHFRVEAAEFLRRMPGTDR